MTATNSIPFLDPRRPTTGIRPLKAWKHFRALIEDKEDTEQVFHIIDALRDKRFVESARAYMTTAAGRRAIAENLYLPDLLDDHDRLKQMPKGSVADAYVTFMEREGLTAAGLVAEQQKFRATQTQYDDLVERYSNRMRDTHDLFHILTGYGRDALGEQCVLAFTYSQSPSWGTLFIAWAGGRQVKKYVPKPTPVYDAIREAQRNGKAAQKIAFQDIEALLAEPLEAARERLGIPTPKLYHKAHDVMRSHGIDPYSSMIDGQIDRVDVPVTELAQAA